MKNYADQGDCFPPRQIGNAIDGWSITHAALFPSEKTKQLTSFLIKYSIKSTVYCSLLQIWSMPVGYGN